MAFPFHKFPNLNDMVLNCVVTEAYKHGFVQSLAQSSKKKMGGPERKKKDGSWDRIIVEYFIFDSRLLFLLHLGRYRPRVVEIWSFRL